MIPPLLLLLLPLAVQGAQDPGADLVRCTACRNVGAEPCGEHDAGKDAEAARLEDGVLLCSAVAGCAACGGTAWVDCGRCTNPATEERLAAKRARQEPLAAEAAPFHEGMGRPLCLAVTEHFLVVAEVERWKVEKRILDGHELLHLYAGRLERLFEEYVALLGLTGKEFRHRVRVLLWSDPADHAEAAARFCTFAGERGVKLLGEDPTYSVPAIKRFFTNDESLHRNVVHHVTHLLLSHQEPTLWIGQFKGGWADAGLAHWFEDRFFGKCDNYCYQEVFVATRLRSEGWRPLVRERVAKDEAPPLAGLFEQNTESLSEEQHLVAFSLVDHLLDHDAARTNELLRRLRSKVATRDALQDVFGWSVLELERSWKAWVLATYPAR